VSAIESDRRRLKQILLNVVGNALKFTEHGRVVVRVVTDAAGVPLQVDVVDSGIGIPPDRMEAIFEPFEQASHDTALRFGGTGLGLAVSNTLAGRLGCRIVVESTVGVGSTFSIRLWATHGSRAA
jgi:signal transduction histidine kinase